MPIRTFNPWGHVSRAERYSRHVLQSQISARLKISKEPEWGELYDLARQAAAGSQIDKQRFNELSDKLNAKGYTDHDIERAMW